MKAISSMRIIDFGISSYGEILDMQRHLFQKMITEKQLNGKVEEEYLLVGEHKPVITKGRHAKKENLLAGYEKLRDKGIDIYDIERGGDITYHCEGQLVAYPLIDLQAHGLGVKKYVDLLEETILRLINKYNIRGKRIEGATGVWIGESYVDERKIAAIGIKCSRFCTMHGIALNVNSDLSGFKLINPCGFTDKGVTSIMKETGKFSDMEVVKKEFSNIFLSLIFPFEEILYFAEKL